MPAFKININDVGELGKAFSFSIEPSWLAEALAGCDVRADVDAPAGAINVSAQKNGREYLVTGKANANLIAECYRCLEDVHVPVHAELAALYAPTPAAKKPDAKKKRVEDDEEMVAADALDQETFDGHEIVLDNFVREQLLLEVPMQPLCREDCPGIPIPEHIKPPADFGRDEVDPRLRPLMNLALEAKGNNKE